MTGVRLEWGGLAIRGGVDPRCPPPPPSHTNARTLRRSSFMICRFRALSSEACGSSSGSRGGGQASGQGGRQAPVEQSRADDHNTAPTWHKL